MSPYDLHLASLLAFLGLSAVVMRPPVRTRR
jgi:hypothetical protein